MVFDSMQRPLARRLAAAILALALAACAVNPSTVTLRSARSPTPTPTAPTSGFSADLADSHLREAAFEQAWTIVNDRFYDPALNGIDWNATRLKYRPQLERVESDTAFYALLGRMVGELRDSHTRVYNEREYRNRLDSVMNTFGARLAEVEGEIAVVEVLQDTSAAAEGVRPGMIVTAINGEEAHARLRRLKADAPADASPERQQRNVYGRLLGGRGDQVTLEVRSSSRPRMFELKRSDREMPVVVSRRILDGNIGLIAFNRFRGDAAAAFARAMRYVADTDGLIIDLRGNPGGGIGAMLSIAQTFFAESRHVLTRRMRHAIEENSTLPETDYWAQVRTPSREVRVNATTHPYTQSIAILVDGYSASSSELLATVLREQRYAYIVGRPSCGCVVAVRGSGYRLPGGGALYVAESGFITPQGNRMEGSGILPDRLVPLRLADLRDGIDRDVLEARAWLVRQAHRTAEEH